VTAILDSLLHYLLVAFGCAGVAALIHFTMDVIDPSPGFFDYGFPYKKIKRYSLAAIIAAAIVMVIIFVVIVLVEALGAIY
jgi:hypothetical protein